MNKCIQLLLLAMILAIIIASLSGCGTSGGGSFPESHSGSSALMVAPVLGIVIDKDMTIVYVEPNSAAERAGIQKGDIIEMVDTLSIASQKAEVRQLIQQTKAGEQHTVRVKRGGSSVDIVTKPDAPTYNSSATPTPIMPPYDYL